MQDEYKQRRAHYMATAYLDDGKAHQEFYQWVAEKLNICDANLPVKMDVILKSTNPHFNDIRLALWDQGHTMVQCKAFAAGMKSWSLSDSVCTLKCYARKRVKEVTK